MKFQQYCQPCRNVPFERFHFNRRTQEPEEAYDQYCTALRKLAEGCEFQTITPGKILRNRLIFGIKDDKVRERLLSESNLTLVKTDEIGHAAESMSAKMKVLSDNSELTMSVVKSIQSKHRSLSEKTLSVSDEKNMRECWNCGRQHEYHKKELYPAFGKICSK